jgi:signal transduction histidine kinase
MNDLDKLWLRTLEEVVNRAAHEVKDSLNGVSLNLEVIRSRSTGVAANGQSLATFASFATSATEQLEQLSARTEAVLFLARPARDPADVALTLKHLASLLVPTAKSEGGSLTVDGYQRSAPTAAPAQATRLALAAGLLMLTKEGGGSRCHLNSNGETVVRFSHESAGACSLDSTVAKAIAEYSISNVRSGSDLILRFPGYP